MLVSFVASSILLLRGTVIASLCGTQSSASSELEVEEFVTRPYDYVIIGGGTAGVALGARLAENPAISIAILEAGTFHINDPLVDIPALSGQAVGNAQYDWNFLTVPQSNAADRQISLPRGKMLGGSSGLNGLAWNRASASEYDAWRLFGERWSWDSILPFFKKSESVATPDNNPYPGISRQEMQEAAADMPRIDGFIGPISASHNTFYFEVVDFFVKAINALGISTNAEPGGGQATGIYNTYASVDRKNGVRSYSTTAYYCQSGPPKNLHILLGARVTKIIFDNSTSGISATGVEFSANISSYSVRATKEVILSSGTLQTPQILELSGIGNSTLLKKVGILPILNLPLVGENLQEHLFVGVQWRLKPGNPTFDILRNNASFAMEEMAKYNATRTGIYTNLDSTVAFVPSGAVTSPEGVAKILAAFDTDSKRLDLTPFQKMQHAIQRSWLVGQDVAQYEIIQWSRGFISPAVNESYIVAIGGVSHPTSRGNVHITTSSPLAPPAIDPQFLSTQFDLISHLELLKFVQSIGQQLPLSEIIEEQTNPDPALQSDEDLLSWIRASSAGGDHLIGTAAMAPQDMGGVVDSDLKVYGTKNLRIVDASIFPLHIAAHTQATVYAIAEMAAEIIKASYIQR